jgi:hypothetical protein
MASQTKARQFLEVAREAFGRSADWVEFSDAIYGIGGPFVRLFPTCKAREAFSRTPEAGEIEAMMQRLPDSGDDAAGQFVLRLPPADEPVILAGGPAMPRTPTGPGAAPPTPRSG